MDLNQYLEKMNTTTKFIWIRDALFLQEMCAVWKAGVYKG